MRLPLVLTCLILLSVLGASSAVSQTAPDATTPAEADYVVGVGDLLRVVVWGEAELSLSVPVRPDGKITLPLINDVSVAGRTPETIRREVATRLGTFIHSPNVTVIIEQINSFTVYFLGEINNQGAVQFVRPTRLLQAIAAAGGLTEFSKKKITLLRERGGIEKRFEIDYKQLVQGVPGQENLFLKPGDTLLFH